MQPKGYEGLSLKDFLQFIFKRKFLILLTFLAIICITTVGTFLIEPIYEAKAQFLVKLGRESIYVPEIGDTKPIIISDRQNQINLEAEIIKSRSLIDEVIAALSPATIYPGLGQPRTGILASILHSYSKPQDPAKTALLNIQSNLEIQVVEDSGIIDVYFKHVDPQMAATVLNELAKCYLERHLNVHKSTRSNAFFREQADNLESELSRDEARMQALKEKYNITFLAEQQRLLLSKITDLRSEFDITRREIGETRNRIAHLRKQLAKTPENIAQIKDFNRNNDLINTLEAQLVELQLRKRQLSTKYSDDSRLVQSVNEEIEMVKKKMAKLEGTQIGTTRWGLNPTFQYLQKELHRSEADLKSLEAKRDIQSVQLKEYHHDLKRLNSIEVEYRHRQQKLELDRQNYRLYLTKLEESRISEAMDSEKIASVRLIEPVQVPIKPTFPRKSLNFVLGLLLGTIGSLGLAFFLHNLDDSMETVESVENCLNVPVLISIPYIKQGKT
jgi:uncharacterized protein involved in exopolysaccharide biosynthesis